MWMLLLACAHRAVAPHPAEERPACTILAVNDSYRIEELAPGLGGMARLRALRAGLEAEGREVLLLHAGDLLYPSLPSRMTGGAHMIEALNGLDGDPLAVDPRMFVVFGNHEFDAAKWKHAPGLRERLEQSQFTWLPSNIRFGRSESFGRVEAPQLQDTARLRCGGLELGLFGLTIDKKPAEYIEAFEDPLAVARDRVDRLRQGGAEVVIGLTHLALEQDRALLEALGPEAPALILGGHEHDAKDERVGGSRILKADADLRSAWLVELRPGPGSVRIDARLRPLDGTIPLDERLQARVDALLAEHARAFCAQKGQPESCLEQEVGRSEVPLIAEELRIRRFETNLGGFVADLARTAAPDADIAFVNSGGLRLNKDLPAGPITMREVEELFAYDSHLTRVELDGATLRRVLARAVEDWTGNGHWLQISGFGFRFDPGSGQVGPPVLLPSGEVIAEDRRLIAVVPRFLVDPSVGDQDGYTMLPRGADLDGELKHLFLEALAAGPIAPVGEGRICVAGHPGPCALP